LRERKSFDDRIGVGREALPYARPPRGLSNENSLMRQRHFARRLLSFRVNTQAHDDSCANYSAPGDQEKPDCEAAG
jgi:hypothetical protein